MATTKVSKDAPSEPRPRGTPREKFTFMLHNKSDMSPAGKYASSDYRYAALKCASKGVEDILLRRTNTKEIREFKGQIVVLDKPKEINRGDRVITYTRKPTVKFVKKWSYNGPELDKEQAAEGGPPEKAEEAAEASDPADPAPAAAAPKKRASRKKAPPAEADAPEPEAPEAPVPAEPEASKSAPAKAVRAPRKRAIKV